MSHDETPEQKKKRAYDDNIEAARRNMIESQVVGFVEQILGRVPTDEEVVRLAHWVNFSHTPLTVFRKGDTEFHNYFVWDRREVLAHRFGTGKDALKLWICRLHRDNWPPALTAYIAQLPTTTEGTA